MRRHDRPRQLLRHNYYGGWSQEQLLELHNTTPILVEHNVLLDSSWPIHGVAGEFRYNLVLEAGHQWMVVASNAYVHHNVFIGGDNDTGGITGYYDGVSARIENNTFDRLNGNLVQTAGEHTLHQPERARPRSQRRRPESIANTCIRAA